MQKGAVPHRYTIEDIAQQSEGMRWVDYDHHGTGKEAQGLVQLVGTVPPTSMVKYCMVGTVQH